MFALNIWFTLWCCFYYSIIVACHYLAVSIESYLNNVLQAYTDYANGYVYCVTTYELNSKGEEEDEIDYYGDIPSDDANIKGLFDLGLLDGELKDWKEAEEQVQTSYIPAE